MDIQNGNIQAQLAAYRASLLHDYTLPSGLQVQLKQVAIQDIAMRKDGIPDTLTPLVDQLLENNDESGMKIKTKDLSGMGDLFNIVVRACVVSPPIADVGDDNHLGIDEIPFNDKEAIFNWANGEASNLVPFRDESKQSDSASLPGEDVQSTA